MAGKRQGSCRQWQHERRERMEGQVHLPLWSLQIVKSRGELAGHPRLCGVLRDRVQVLWR